MYDHWEQCTDPAYCTPTYLPTYLTYAVGRGSLSHHQPPCPVTLRPFDLLEGGLDLTV